MHASQNAISILERRQSPRQRALRKALIVFNNANCTMNCQIVEVSETGAKLIPDDPLSVPEHFLLKPRDGEPRYCEIKWRNGTSIGAQYVLAHNADQQASDCNVVSVVTAIDKLAGAESIRRVIENGIVTNVGDPRSAALILVGIENKNEIRELFGENALEPVIEALVNKLRACFRASDVIARFNESQIAIVLPHVRSNGISVAIKKILALAPAPLVTPNGPLTVKLAATTVLFPDGDLSPVQIIARAQANLAYSEERKSPQDIIAALRRTSSVGR
jgi:GGDEF domain-containing protein